jgi:hypothetical protein
MSVRSRRLLAAAWVLLCVSTTSRAAVDFSQQAASEDARYVAGRVVDGADNGGMPFVVVDKKDARLYVFEPDGHLIGASPVLLGLAPGDFPVIDPAHQPGHYTPAERTTPSGRFVSEPGRNDKGEDIVWFDYAAALAIHRLRPAPPREQRVSRMESPSAGDHRISEGCIVVPVAFYDSVLRPTLGSHRGVVYVLPEASPVQALFGKAELVSRAP